MASTGLILRFGLQLFNVSQLVSNSGFAVFKNAVDAGGQVKGVVYPGAANGARREIDELTEFVKQYGAKGLAWIGVTGAPAADGAYPAEALRSQVTKFLTPEEISGIITASGAQVGDLICWWPISPAWWRKVCTTYAWKLDVAPI